MAASGRSSRTPGSPASRGLPTPPGPDSPVTIGAPETAGRPDSPSDRPAVAPSPGPGGEDGASALLAALRDVMDPELPLSLVDLGLVYGVRARAGVVEVDLTYTATGCPCMEFIHDDVRARLLREPGVTEVRIRDVWDPPWTSARISAAGRAALRRHGVAA